MVFVVTGSVSEIGPSVHGLIRDVVQQNIIKTNDNPVLYIGAPCTDAFNPITYKSIMPRKEQTNSVP